MCSFIILFRISDTKRSEKTTAEIRWQFSVYLPRVNAIGNGRTSKNVYPLRLLFCALVFILKVVRELNGKQICKHSQKISRSSDRKKDGKFQNDFSLCAQVFKPTRFCNAIQLCEIKIDTIHSSGNHWKWDYSLPFDFPHFMSRPFVFISKSNVLIYIWWILRWKM